MRNSMFAAIDIGSYELSMKIFEISTRNGLKEIDFIRYRLDIGRDTYSSGKISIGVMNELCGKLLEFKKIMEEYRVTSYRVCTTSAIRETVDFQLVLEQICARTGITVEILSNSEQRFLGYKSVALQEEIFDRMIQRGTAIADIGGGSLQISLFDKETLVTTQNMRLGTLRISEKLSGIAYRSTQYTNMLEELIENELANFEKLYLKGQKIKNIIAIGDFIARVIYRLTGNSGQIVEKKQFMDYCEENIVKSPEWIAEDLELPKDYCPLILPTFVIFREILEKTGAETIWANGAYLCDGIAYDYATEKKYLKPSHNFDHDILAASKNIAKRYMCNKSHTHVVQEYALTIFDAMKKIHNMGKRERLLLEIATMLHDCGKYISMTNGAECSYNIIISTEIIGLSHKERDIVASVVLYNTIEVEDKKKLIGRLGTDGYLKVQKLVAILRLANVLDRSHRQKIQKIKAVIHEECLVITAYAMEDVSLELGMFDAKSECFRKVYSMDTELKISKSYSNVK